MARLGMVSLRHPSAGEIEILGSVPRQIQEEAGYHFP
jgi:hypothetical protein